jgi:hypothetical protein
MSHAAVLVGLVTHNRTSILLKAIQSALSRALRQRRLISSCTSRAACFCTKPGHGCIHTRMTLMQENPLTIFVSLIPGSPSCDGKLRAQAAPTLDNQGNSRFKTFSSRRFVLSKQRFEKLLPTPLRYISIKRRLLMQVGFGNAIWPWEYC